MRPVPLAIARRYQPLSGPWAERTYSVVADAHDPHRHVRAQAAVVATGGELELFGGTDAVEFVGRSRSAIRRADPDEGLDGAPVVHRRVGLGDVVGLGLEVEDKAGVDAAVEDVVEQFWDVAAVRGGTEVPADVAEEDVRERYLDAVRGHRRRRRSSRAGRSRTWCSIDCAVPTHSIAESTAP